MSKLKPLLAKVYKMNKETFFRDLEMNLKDGQKKFIITANPEIMMKSRDNAVIYKMLNDNDNIVVADGIGVVKAIEMLKIGNVERIPGVEIVQQLFALANTYKKSICILGAKQEVLDALKQKINKLYPEIPLLHCINGYVDDKDQTIQSFAKMNADIVLVALGVPKQELLIYDHISDFHHGILIGIGGSLDVISGTKRRAPRFFIKCNLEWLYRICCEPKRLKRFYQSNIKFVKAIRKEQ